jgi:hypothetical protein
VQQCVPTIASPSLLLKNVPTTGPGHAGCLPRRRETDRGGQDRQRVRHEQAHKDFFAHAAV